MAEIIDCTQGGSSFSLDEGDDGPTPAMQVVREMEENPPGRTTRASRSSAYQCENDQETAKHQSLIQLLCRYGESSNFGSYLHAHGFRLTPAHLRTLPTEDLEDTLVRVRASVNTKNVSNFWEEATFGALKGTEILCVNSPINHRFKIAGLTEALRQDQTFRDCVAQFELEMGDYSAIPVHWRIVYSIVGAAMKQHTINKFVESRGQAPHKAEEITETATDGATNETSEQAPYKPPRVVPPGVLDFESTG